MIRPAFPIALLVSLTACANYPPAPLGSDWRGPDGGAAGVGGPDGGAGGVGGGEGGAGPTIELSASPDELALGELATLTWEVTGATECEASGGWSGAIEPTTGSAPSMGLNVPFPL